MLSVRRWLDDREARRRFRRLEESLEALDDADPLHRCAEAAERNLGLRPRRSQWLAALAMRDGAVVELPTGEGKSLALALTATCLAMQGRGVRIGYPNDYLALRDADTFAPLHRALGVSCAGLPKGSRRERRKAYRADIVYGSSREFAFDLVRDEMRLSAAQRVASEPDALLIDEVDALLVDDAVVPLVLAQRGEPAVSPATLLDPVADQLVPDIHYSRERQSAELTPEGLERAAELLPAHDLLGSALLQLALRRALEARVHWQQGEHYLVEADQVVLIDWATGRRAPGRRLSGGLHAAIEAKERVSVRGEPAPRARTSHRAMLQRYASVAGCSATVAEAAQTLETLHGLSVVIVPPDLPSRRTDEPDRFHATDEAKLATLVERTRDLHGAGRPVLLSVPSDVEASHLSRALQDLGPQTLTSADEGHERNVLARAGALGSVTIATRLASRGTDIRLGPDADDAARARALGGLAVVLAASPVDGRLERQIRGRAGRQGDPGSTELHVSPGDSLLRRHLTDDERRELRDASATPGRGQDVHELHRRARQRAQDALESGRSMRAHIDQVADLQSEAHSAHRRRLLDGTPREDASVNPDIEAECAVAVRRLLRASKLEREATLPVRRWARDVYRLTGTWIPPQTLMGQPAEEATVTAVARSLSSRWETLQRMGEGQRDALVARTGAEGYRRVLLAAQWIHLAELDLAWTEHLRLLSDLEATLGFRAFERGDPLLSMKRAAHEAFAAMGPAVEAQVVERLLALPPLRPEVLQGLMLRSADD